MYQTLSSLYQTLKDYNPNSWILTFIRIFTWNIIQKLYVIVEGKGRKQSLSISLKVYTQSISLFRVLLQILMLRPLPFEGVSQQLHKFLSIFEETSLLRNTCENRNSAKLELCDLMADMAINFIRKKFLRNMFQKHFNNWLHNFFNGVRKNSIHMGHLSLSRSPIPRDLEIISFTSWKLNFM